MEGPSLTKRASSRVHADRVSGPGESGESRGLRGGGGGGNCVCADWGVESSSGSGSGEESSLGLGAYETVSIDTGCRLRGSGEGC